MFLKIDYRQSTAALSKGFSSAFNFKTGENIALPEYLTGLLSILAIALSVNELTGKKSFIKQIFP